MTKDVPPTRSSCPQTMDKKNETLHLNLNEPLTDQLSKHQKFLPYGTRWRDDDKGTSAHAAAYYSKEFGSKDDVVGGSGVECGSSEIIDLAMRKRSMDDSKSNHEANRNGLIPGKGHAEAFAGTIENESVRRPSAFDRLPKNSNSLIKSDLYNNKSVKDQQNSSDRGKDFGYLPGQPGNNFPAVINSLKAESSAPEPLPPLKKNQGGIDGSAAKIGSAFLPVGQQPRDLSASIPPPALYKNPGYAFGFLPFSQSAVPNAPSVFDYSSLPHSSLLPPSALDHQGLKDQTPYVVSSAGTILTPYVLFQDNLMTHQLEVLWQRKYPHIPVPPVWMLYQYMDELLRETGRLPLDKLPGREFYSSTFPGVGSSPAALQGIPFGAAAEKKKEKNEKNLVPVETKKFDGRTKEELMPKRRNNCLDYKELRSADFEEHRNKTPADWNRSSQPKRGGGGGAGVRPGSSSSGGGGGQQAVPPQRRELLIDESAASAFDAVDQHFKESLQRLNTQSLVDHVHKDRIDHRNQSNEQTVDKRDAVVANGVYHWTDGAGTKTNAKARSYETYDQVKPSSYNLASHLAPTKPGQISYDIYGYQPQRRPEHGAENFHGMTRKEVLPSKAQSTSPQNWSYNERKPNFSEKIHRDADRRVKSEFPRHVSKVEPGDRLSSGANSASASSKAYEKPSNCGDTSSKQLHDVRFLVGNQSVASPVPGSAIRDSQHGPSRLIAGSPKPLPNVFYNPLDPRMEPVQPCQVSIEPVERWRDGSSWVEYRPEFRAASRAAGISSNSIPHVTSASLQIETSNGNRIGQSLTQNPLYFSGETGRRSNEALCHQKLSQEAGPLLAKMSRSDLTEFESHKIPVKRFAVKEEEVQDYPKKPRPNGAEPWVLTLKKEPSPIDNFKSFVDQAVYNAFLEDSDRALDNPKPIDVSRFVGAKFELGKVIDACIEKDCDLGKSSSEGNLSFSHVAGVNLATEGTLAVNRSRDFGGDISSSGKQTPASNLNRHHRSEPFSDNLSTVSCDTSSSDPQNGANSVTNATSIASPSPSPPPRVASGSSLHLKKAWLLRYSDNDQKNLSDVSSGGFFHDDVDSQSNCSGTSGTDKQKDGASSVRKFKTGLLDSTVKVHEDKETESSSEASVDSNSKEKQISRVKTVKRKCSAEPPTRHSKLLKPSSARRASDRTRTANDPNSRRAVRGNELSRLQTKSDRLVKDDDSVKSASSRNDSRKHDGTDDSCSTVASDNETKTRLRKKNLVRRNSESLDSKDEDASPGARQRKTCEVFLQDGPCYKVAPRLPKCHECKALRVSKGVSETSNICKFLDFRKLRHNTKGVLSVAGLLEPSDAEANDVDLWMPSKSKSSPVTPAQAKYLVEQLKEYFCSLLQQQTSLSAARRVAEESSGQVLWRRPIEGVQETCDVCDAVVFDVHWMCSKCGFVVCNDCRSENLVDDDSNEDEAKQKDWPPCSVKRQSHDPDELTMTQVIPSNVPAVMLEMLNRVSDCNESKSVGEVRLNGKIPEDLPISVEATEKPDAAEPEKGDSRTVDSDAGVERRPEDETAAAVNASSGDGSDDASVSIKVTMETGSCKETVAEAIEGCAVSTASVSPNGVRHWFDGQQVLHISGNGEESIGVFQDSWRQAKPVVISDCDKRSRRDLWKPETFSEKFGHLKVDFVSCLTGAVHRVQSMEKFLSSLKNSTSTMKTSGLLQCKDWPLPDDWTGSLGEHLADLNSMLPIPSYTLTTGPLNLASHMPEFFPQPDLSMLINVGCGDLGRSQVSLSRLQSSPVDFVNVLVSAEDSESDDDVNVKASFISKLLQDSAVTGDTTLVTRVPGDVAAIWHVYRPADSDKIETFLKDVQGGSPKDETCYLEADLQEKLRTECNVKSDVILQCLGDAVFVPATAFYQIKVIQDCFSVTKEFISSESVRSSFTKSLQSKSSQSTTTEDNRREQLQIKNLVYHTMKDSIAVLSDMTS